MRTTLLLACLAAPALAYAPLAHAQAPERVRGAVASLTGDTLVVHATNGDDVTVTLPPDVSVRADTPATAAAIKTGGTIGIVSRTIEGKQMAVAIQVVPPGMPFRLGVFPWDLPESTMTNATVEGDAVATDGRTLTLKAGDKTVTMGLSPDADIATIGDGSRAMLTPGTKVVVFMAPGGAAARAVILGANGSTPPL